MATGCASPTHHSRCHVSDGVQSRTGYDLGPPKSPCEQLFDESINWDDGLSEKEAIAIGIWNNPAYQELLADLQITRADIIQAAQLTNPQVITMFPVGPKQWEFFLSAPLDILWLRPIRVSAAELESHRVAERLVQDGLNVIRDIRIAYINWQLAVQQAELAEQGARMRREVARVAEARLAAGYVAELDVSAIRLDALVATGEAARATRDAELSYQRLRYALGLQLSDLSFRPALLPEHPAMDFDIEELVSEAVSSRPDLRAIQLAVCAAQDRAKLAQRSIWQIVGIVPDINSRGKKGFEAGPGLQFSIPLFHQNQGEIAQAEADADRLKRQYVNRRDLAALEVKQAYIQLLQAKKDLEIWRDQILPQANQAVNSSRKALEEDGVSLLLVLETTRQLQTAQQRDREADAQLRRAIAELERSVGRRLVNVDTSNSPNAEILPDPPVEVKEDTP